ncbi:Crp/Fnr family transcriptional regulator [Actinomadura formosensis]|uniref:Crp/Fnr family transcriptional regulator n=1 Tax=Actinomadura formosensis TaxID=60706 RepID=UPI003D8F6182
MAAERYKPGEPIFTEEQLAILKKEGQILQRPPKHLFFKEGEWTNFVLVPLKGHLKVTKGAPERLIGIRNGLQPVGESSARYGSPRSANVLSIRDVEVLHLSANQWNNFVDDNPRVLDALNYMLTRRLGEADERLAHTELAAEPRLALALQELIESGLGDHTDAGVLLELDHEELSQVSGLSVESVKKIMKIFRDGNLVRTGRRRVIVQDVPFLRKIATGDRTASARRATAE